MSALPAEPAPEAAGAPKASPIPLTHLRALARLAAKEAGIVVADDRGDFLVARLRAELIRLGLPDYATYAAHLSAPGHTADRRRFTEALTTHTTSFFRERAQYDWLAKDGFALVTESKAPGAALEIWSAACSSGQELYSALMLASQSAVLADRRLQPRGTGTDLSRAILRRAKQAVYGRAEIDGIPSALRHHYLLVGRDDPELFRIAAEIRDKARWGIANLTEPSSHAGITADIAFLRNVLIYFDADTRDRVLTGVISRIRPGGVLLTGHSETIEAKRYGLVSLRPTIYRKET